MKLGTSQRGTGVPALVAFMVLASVGVALAGRPEARSPAEPSPSAAPSSPGRSGHHGETPRSRPTEAPAAPAACTPALETGAEALEHRTGLERAIEVILENCGKGPQATGLLTALGRLEANQARQGAGRSGGQPNEHANDAATNERGPSAQQGQSDEPHGQSDHGSAAVNPAERGTPAPHR